MKTSNKGFTLIELLSVIVILAIIALIVTPIVLKQIDNARRGAAESDVYAYISAVETAAVEYLLGHYDANIGGEYTVNANGTLTSGKVTLIPQVKGSVPKAGIKITLASNGTVDMEAITDIDIGGYKVSYDL